MIFLSFMFIALMMLHINMMAIKYDSPKQCELQHKVSTPPVKANSISEETSIE